MAIHFNGIELRADEWKELHEFARKVGVSRSWFSLEPVPHYEIICPFRAEMVWKMLERRGPKHVNKKQI